MKCPAKPTMFDDDADDGSVSDDWTVPAPEAAPRWTLRRVLVMLIVLITLIAFLAYTFLYSGVTARRDAPPPPPVPFERT